MIQNHIMFNFFFRKKGPKLEDLSFLGTDIHSHLIPGIDDGAKDLKDSVILAKGMIELGFTHLITTPHVMSGLYPNTTADIKTGLSRLTAHFSEIGLEITIEAAAEYMLDEGFETLLEREDLLTFGKNYILFEMSMISGHPAVEDLVFKMRTKGYFPILAHPERYLYLRDRLSLLDKLKSMGCKLQLNLLSLTGYYGSNIKKFAFKLVEKGMIDFVGSDLHNEKQLTVLQGMLSDHRINQLLLSYPFKNKTLNATA